MQATVKLTDLPSVMESTTLDKLIIAYRLSTDPAKAMDLKEKAEEVFQKKKLALKANGRAKRREKTLSMQCTALVARLQRLARKVPNEAALIKHELNKFYKAKQAILKVQFVVKEMAKAKAIQKEKKMVEEEEKDRDKEKEEDEAKKIKEETKPPVDRGAKIQAMHKSLDAIEQNWNSAMVNPPPEPEPTVNGKTQAQMDAETEAARAASEYENEKAAAIAAEKAAMRERPNGGDDDETSDATKGPPAPAPPPPDPKAQQLDKEWKQLQDETLAKKKADAQSAAIAKAVGVGSESRVYELEDD
jgi:hypothetical protein